MFEKIEVDYAQAIRDELDRLKMSYREKERQDGDIQFVLPMSLEAGPGLQVHLVVSEKGDSKLRSYPVNDVPVIKRDDVIHTLNELNGEYRYISLSLDEDGDVSAAYDFALFGDEEEVAHHAVTMLMLYTDICSECYPRIMRSVWGL